MRNSIILFTLPFYLISGLLHMENIKGNYRNTAVSSFTNNSKIFYLFFKVEKTKSGSEKITLQEKRTVDGTLKANPVSNESNAEIGDFIIAVSDASGKEIARQIIEDPLNPTREVYGEDISRNKISLQNAEFSVRYSHSENSQQVKVEKMTKSGKQLIFIQKL